MSHKRRKESKAKYYVCEERIPACTHCPHAVPHLVVPSEFEVCSGWCAFRDMQKRCVRIKGKFSKFDSSD